MSHQRPPCLCTQRSDIRCDAGHCDLIRKGEAYDIKQHCRVCWLYFHSEAHNRAWGGDGRVTPAPPPETPLVADPKGVSKYRQRLTIPCIHLGPETGEKRDCTYCGGAKQVPLRACAVHGRCTNERKLRYRDERGDYIEVPWCVTCADYQPSANPVHAGMSALAMLPLLERPIPAKGWPDGWERWDATRDAHALLFDRAVAHPLPFPGGEGRGIVTVAGGSKYFACAWILLWLLRRVHGCTLSVEVWHLGPAEMDHRMCGLLESFGGVTIRDALQVAQTLPRQPRQLGGWEAKVFALAHTRFAEALFLDADQVPLRDPASLFDWPEYQAKGCVLWPDIPNHLGLDIEEAAFRCLRLPVPGKTRNPRHHRPSDYRPVESGQVLIDRQRRWPELSLALTLADHADYLYRWEKQRQGINLIYGDKSIFALAFWRLAQESGKAPANYFDGWPNFAMPADCGWAGSNAAGAFLQRDFQGQPWTAHRAQPASKWSLHDKNAGSGSVPLHAECEQALAELRRQWIGHPWDQCDQSPRDTERTAQVAGPYLLYQQDRPERAVTLQANGAIQGWPGHHWTLRHDGDSPFLVLASTDRAICFLGPDPVGSWQNQGTSTTLIPTPPEGWQAVDRFGVEAYTSIVWGNEYRLPAAFQPQDVILDVGAHVGSFTRACLDRGAGRVVAVEPNPALLPALVHNVGHDLRVRVIPAAARDVAGHARLAHSQGAAHSGGGMVGDAGPVEVTCVAFDDLVTEKVRLLKLDCEGSEWPILTSSQKLHLIEEICGEYHLSHGTHTAEDIRRLLAPHGFHVTLEPHPGTFGLGHFWASRP